jgi:hypothetical protein
MANILGTAGTDIFRYRIDTKAELCNRGADTIARFDAGKDKIDFQNLFRDLRHRHLHWRHAPKLPSTPRHAIRAMESMSTTAQTLVDRRPLSTVTGRMNSAMDGRLLSPQARRPLPVTPMCSRASTSFSAQTLADGRGQFDRDGEPIQSGAAAP